ncbi:MAG: TerB family tellurite resistance protein [Bacteroidetes bacterium]|nr:TerB family tellurite resistance protein [Bacteroidota bacterium]
MNSQSAFAWKEFYQKLGYLYYGVASADKQVTAEETDMLKKLVRQVWTQYENSLDEFGADTAYNIETVFDWLLLNDATPDQCMDEFAFFLKNHAAQMSPELKKMILESAERIATAFSRISKSEMRVLQQLGKLLA